MLSSAVYMHSSTPNYPYGGDNNNSGELLLTDVLRDVTPFGSLSGNAIGQTAGSDSVASASSSSSSNSTASYGHNHIGATSDDAFPSDHQQNSSVDTSPPPVTIVEPSPPEESSSTSSVEFGGLGSWSLPPSTTIIPYSSQSSKSITPPTDADNVSSYNTDLPANPDPFGYTSTLAPSYDLTHLNNFNSFGGLLFNNTNTPNVGLMPAMYGTTTRRWSLTDPPSAAASSSSLAIAASSSHSQQRPWTSIASGGGGFGSMSSSSSGGLGLGSLGHGIVASLASASASTASLQPNALTSTLSPDPANAHHLRQNANNITTSNNNNNTVDSSNITCRNTNTFYRTYSDDSSPMAPSFSTSSNTSRPSTSSSFQSIGTPQGDSFFLSGTGAATSALYGDMAVGDAYLKRRVSSSSGEIGGGAGASFYGLGLDGGNESTDTICLPPTSSHGPQTHGFGQHQRVHHHHRQHAPPASAPPTSTSFFQPQQQQQQQQLQLQQQDDSNPFYFERELQLLQAQSHRQFDATSLPHPIRPSSQHVLQQQQQQQQRPGSGYLEPHLHRQAQQGQLHNRPTSGYLEPQSQSQAQGIHPSLQTAIASTSPNDQYLFFEGEQNHNNGHQLLTPPSTAGSSAYFDPGMSLPRPPRTGGGDSFTMSPYHQHSSLNNSFDNGGYGDVSPPSTGASMHHNSNPSHTFRRHSSHTSNPNDHSQHPSPYSLIIQNPDPATSTSRPHLCTHCNETFRRIHDAKRHAFGALGIKNYACMGGCGMTFKRSEGRARHWMREEVVGVGVQIEVGEFFRRNPGLVGIGGGVKSAEMMSGGGGGGGGKGSEGRDVMLWGGKGCEERHAKMMSGTMEEDRRLRNKARRERIKTMDARDKKDGSDDAMSSRPNTSNGIPPRSSFDDHHQSSSESPQPGVPMMLGQTSPTNGQRPYSSGGVGPVRHFRLTHAVAPY
ncbi:hypothetical protein FRB98_003856 [Tulasnella sp. 332]|nr:hypothetical protein FRB98_003856 [Tulasnella sp. 332]